MPRMSKVRVDAFSVSADGYGAGPSQDLKNPLGIGGAKLHEWLYPTHTFQSRFEGKSGTTGIDDDFARKGLENVGAWILGRNMFGPVRGDWPDDSWKGWWGDEPPYHVPVFVLTHHRRPSFEMAGDTTFHFVTSGIEEALRRAKEAAGSQDVRIGGGVSTVRRYLEAQLIDEMHVAITPLVLGSGERLWSGLNLPALGYSVTRHIHSDAALHVVIGRSGG